MHISLDSALGRQRRLNQVGESITQIAPDPAAAYSLRSLTGSDPKVVRVRRESDNDERDFTASEVSSGALVDFVNTQVTAPLDIQALTSTGRDGDFLIAKAAYSLRSLGTRQATVTSSGDTAGDTSGKYVCQVRRGSDDTIKSFTADEVTDGTLRNFCLNDDTNIISFADAGLAGSPAANKRMYFSGTSDRVESNTTVDESSDFFIKTNVVWFGNRDEVIFSDRGSSERLVNAQVHTVNDKVKVQVETSAGFSILFFSTSDLPKFQVVEVMLQHTVSTKTLELFFDGVSQGSGNYTGTSTPANRTTVEIGSETNGARLFNGILSNFNYNNETIQLGYGNTNADWTDTVGSNNGTVVGSPALFTGQGFDGFVRTWYDQSVSDQAGNTPTGNHATQTTAGSQPKIVSSGAVILENNQPCIDFTSTSTSDSDTQFLVGSTLSVVSTVMVMKLDAYDGTTNVLSTRVSSSSGIAYDFNSNQAHFRSFGSGGNNTLSLNVSNIGLSQSVFSSFHIDGSFGASVNGSLTTSSSSISYVAQSTQALTIGKRTGSSGGNQFNGTMQELLVYDTDQTDNRTAIEANIGEHYSISGIPAFDNSVNGFVETWYDQSGNSNDLTQATASKQPTIVTSGAINTRNSEPIIKFIQANSTHLEGASSVVPTGTDFSLTCFQALHIDASSGNRIGIFGSSGSGSNPGTSKYGFGNAASRKVTVRIQDASDTVTALESSALSNDTDSILTYMIKLNDGSLEFQTFNLGAQLGSTLTSSVTDQSYNFTADTRLGARSGGDNFSDSEFFEVLFYATDQLTNRDAIEANLSNKYGISLS